MKDIFAIFILLTICTELFAQGVGDSGSRLVMKTDSITKRNNDSLVIRPPRNMSSHSNIEGLVSQNKLLNLSQPISIIVNEKQQNGKEFLFYLIASLCVITGMVRVFYTRYFNTIFRVYFNTSLRQNQLTDLLLQAKLSSLIFNILFFVNGGLYACLLIRYYHLKGDFGIILILSSIMILALIYIGKYLAVRFIGWLAGMKEAAETYIFIVFLINKILGILLLPFIILLAFSPTEWQSLLIISSGLILLILYLSRYFRSYDLLQQKLKISKGHFFLYIISFEILPVIILAKIGQKILNY